MPTDPLSDPQNRAAFLDQLSDLIVSRAGRSSHLLPDMALKMFAVQTLQYGRTLSILIDNGLTSWAFPTARSAFETAEDMAYLAFAQSVEEYDQLGALAMVGAEIATSKMNGLARNAGAVLQRPPLPHQAPERERIAALAAQWAAFHPSAEKLVWDAHSLATEAWSKGKKHWTTLSRQSIHDALDARLDDLKLSAVLTSWYDILAVRSHPGLHSPKMKWENTQVTFITDGDENNPVPLASLKTAVNLATFSLQHQFHIWDSAAEPPNIG